MRSASFFGAVAKVAPPNASAETITSVFPKQRRGTSPRAARFREGGWSETLCAGREFVIRAITNANANGRELVFSVGLALFPRLPFRFLQTFPSSPSHLPSSNQLCPCHQQNHNYHPFF